MNTAENVDRVVSFLRESGPATSDGWDGFDMAKWPTCIAGAVLFIHDTAVHRLTKNEKMGIDHLSIMYRARRILGLDRHLAHRLMAEYPATIDITPEMAADALLEAHRGNRDPWGEYSMAARQLPSEVVSAHAPTVDANTYETIAIDDAVDVAPVRPVITRRSLDHLRPRTEDLVSDDSYMVIIDRGRSWRPTRLR